jgi:hypothetical protein
VPHTPQRTIATRSRTVRGEAKDASDDRANELVNDAVSYFLTSLVPELDAFAEMHAHKFKDCPPLSSQLTHFDLEHHT